MSSGIIVIQGGATKKDGTVHILSWWKFILQAYGEILPGTRLVCPEDETLRDKQTLPVPDGLEPVLLKRMKAAGLIGKCKDYYHACKKIKELVSNADFVGTVLPSHLGTLAAVAALKQGKPLFFECAGQKIFHIHEFSFALPFLYAVYLHARYIEARVTRKADLAMYVSVYLEEKAGRLPRPSAVVPHTTIRDEDIFVRKDTCTGDKVHIISANRIVYEKGLQNLLLAVRKLRDEGFNITATLAGDGNYLSKLKRQCTELKLDDAVSFPGHINAGPDLWRLYRQADIMVLPSMAEYEGTPKCIIEAMALSCPVVTCPVGGIGIMLEESGCGMLVKPGDINDLVQAIKTVIQKGELRRQYIANGQEWVRSATLRKRSEKVRELIEKYLPAAGLLKR